MNRRTIINFLCAFICALCSLIILTIRNDPIIAVFSLIVAIRYVIKGLKSE